MSLFGSNKKQQQSAPLEQSAILQCEDANKNFGAVAIKRSLEIAILATSRTQDERNRPYATHQPEQFDSLAIHKPILEGLVIAFGMQNTNLQWLNVCKQSICDALTNKQIHKNYLLTGIVKGYLPFRRTIDMLLGSSFDLLTPDEMATIIDSINYQTGQNAEHLQHIIHSRQNKERVDNRATYLGTLTIAQIVKEARAKEALLHSIPSNAAPKLSIMIYETIRQIPQENQKGMIEKFFFKKDSTLDIRVLIKELKENQGGQAVTALMVLLDDLYDPEELQQKDPGLEEYIANL